VFTHVTCGIQAEYPLREVGPAAEIALPPSMAAVAAAKHMAAHRSFLLFRFIIVLSVIDYFCGLDLGLLDCLLGTLENFPDFLGGHLGIP